MKKKKSKFVYKKLIVKIDGEVVSPKDYDIVKDQITFKIAPEANAKIEFFIQNK